MPSLAPLRQAMRKYNLVSEADALSVLQKKSTVTVEHRQIAQKQALEWVKAIRQSKNNSLMDVFMAEYGLSTDEGIALMCLAEALLRVPDTETIDVLIEDKIAPSNWGAHLGKSASSLVNASTWALMLTGRVLDDQRPLAGVLHGVIKRLGEPVIREAIRRAMRELGTQFVLGQNIDEAIKNGQKNRDEGFTYSYDMLGEAAWTAKDADAYFKAYMQAITKTAHHCHSKNPQQNPGISIKLSALYERFQEMQADQVAKALVPKVLELALAARSAGMGLNIDAEEVARLELSMDVIEAVLRSPSLAGWDGFGIVVQAYGKRARFVIDWYYALARALDRKVMLRLVKGAYWDSEIKLAQVKGLSGFPVFETKSATDISYIENAAHLLALTDRIYPQFATHNAHSVAMIKAMAGDFQGYEFQRLHGMGGALYAEVMREGHHKCRIYAPVGEHEDLLAYLVRRLLENGANSSFVNQIINTNITAEEAVSDPYLKHESAKSVVALPAHIFGKRLNSRGWDLDDRSDLQNIEEVRKSYACQKWSARSLTVENVKNAHTVPVTNPANGTVVGELCFTDAFAVEKVVVEARPWQATVDERARVLRRTADIYEKNFGEISALLTREAGKVQSDVVAELREAVDFLRYYADQAGEYHNCDQAGSVGIFVCISPWNFPLAIFTGQIAAALAAGNAVIAKPAEATSLIAFRAVEWLLEAGVPRRSLQLLLGYGYEVGNALTCHSSVGGVCFTGSTATAQQINRNMASHMAPDAPLIAETGGLNAMIIDSTALPEQAVRDIIISAFQSAGQRCSALRVLYLQADIADHFLEMLYGAMDALKLGDPWALSNDIGPVIDQNAEQKVKDHIAKAAFEGRVLKTIPIPDMGYFVPPTIVSLFHISELEQEIFGPVLHVIRYEARNLDKVIDEINATGYGLTFGLHSRIDDRVEHVAGRIRAGNIYINRNQIGAIVGSQPFGGKGLSGTGPKAGGPLYLHRFYKDIKPPLVPEMMVLPGPTGESNQWLRQARGVVLCAGPGDKAAQAQAEIARAQGCDVLLRPSIMPSELQNLPDIAALVYWGNESRAYRQALAMRQGPVLPFIQSKNFAPYCWLEQHICVDTTASGGNTELLAGLSKE